MTEDKTSGADATEKPSIVTLVTPTQAHRGTGINVKENIFLLGLLFPLLEIIKRVT